VGPEPVVSAAGKPRPYPGLQPSHLASSSLKPIAAYLRVVKLGVVEHDDLRPAVGGRDHGRSLVGRPARTPDWLSDVDLFRDQHRSRPAI
jgi:hypothetical protein